MSSNENPLVIVQVSANKNMTTGDYIYRIDQPARAMAEIPGMTVINITNTSPYLRDFCIGADVLVIHLIGEHDFLPIVIERKRRKLPTVFEISDNFTAFPHESELKSWFSDPDNLSTTFQLIGLSDAIQGASDILLDRFGFLHEVRMTFKNNLMDLGKVPKTSTDETVTIGWAGSGGHTQDLMGIAGVIRTLCERNSQVRFSFMGSRQLYEAVFGPSEDMYLSYRKPGTLTDYFDFLGGLDIGIAPLLETPYNICRSDVKFIEYASRGVVPVLSDVGPYRKNVKHGENAFLFKDQDELKSILTSLIADPHLFIQMKHNVYNYAKNNRMERSHAMERISFYRRLISNPASFSPLPLAHLQKIDSGCEYYHVKQTPAEKKIIQGAIAQSEGALKEAELLWLEAAREFPEYAFPFVCLGKGHMRSDSNKAIEYLMKALSIEPKSLRTRLLLGQAFKVSGNIERAYKEFEKILQIVPEFGPALVEIALLEQEAGRLDHAEMFFDRALTSNPFHAEAAFRLGKIYLEQERDREASDAFGIAADLIPENIPYREAMLEVLLKSSSRLNAGTGV
ncbi:MAG: hypothetical protein ACOWYE_12810 [Desulfatiglandales bacterium]